MDITLTSVAAQKCRYSILLMDRNIALKDGKCFCSFDRTKEFVSTAIQFQVVTISGGFYLFVWGIFVYHNLAHKVSTLFRIAKLISK